jgi:hypothetical protein
LLRLPGGRAPRLLAAIAALASFSSLSPDLIRAQDRVLVAPVDEQVQERPGLMFGLTRIPYPWEIDLLPTRWTDPAPLRPGDPAEGWLATEMRNLDQFLAARRDTMWLAGLPLDKLPPDFEARRFYELELESDEVGTPFEVRDQQRIEIIPDALKGIADLDLQISGQGQLNSRWQVYDPCLLGTGQRCNAGAVPDIAPEFQLKALARGTISERVHLDVDFDQTREFDATNNLNVYYEGKSDEILQFVELGQVTLPLPRSRFISQAVPAGNFGVRGDARLGPLNVRGVFAEQKGSVENRAITLDVGGPEAGTFQDVEVILDDAAYTNGQFFFVVDPRELDGYPDAERLKDLLSRFDAIFNGTRR